MRLFEAYRIAVRLRLVDHVTGGLVSISQRFALVHGQAAALQRQLHQIRLTAMTGFGLGAAGIVGLLTLRGPYREASEFINQVGRFRSLGFGEAFNAQAVQFAQGMRVVGSSVTQNMGAMTDAMNVFGTMEQAQFMAPILARVGVVFRARFGAGSSQDRQFMDLLRAVDKRGGLETAATAEREVNALMQAYAGSGGRVDPAQLDTFLRRALTAGRLLSADAMYYTMPSIIQELGAPGAGRALRTAYGRLHLGNIDAASGDMLMRLGIINRDEVQLNSLGRYMRFRSGASPLIDAERQASDPFGWYIANVIPRLAGKSPLEISRINNALGGRWGGALFDTFYMQRAQLERDTAINRRALNLDQEYANVLGNTQAGRHLALAAAWETLMVKIGLHVIPMVNAGLDFLIPRLQGMADWVERHPVLVQALVVAFASLATAMAIGGIVLLVTAAFRGLGIALGLLAGRGIIGAIVSVLSLGLIPALTALVAAVGWPVTLVFGIVAGLTALGVWFYENNQMFANAVDSFLAQLQRLLQWIENGSTARNVRTIGQSLLQSQGFVDANGRMTAAGADAARRFMETGRSQFVLGGVQAPDRPLSLLEAWRDANWREAQAQGRSPFIRPPAANNNTPQGNVYLNGRIVGEVADGIVAQMRSPAVAAGRPDQGRAPAPVAMPYTPR